MSARPIVIIMARLPRMGTVKTRLAREIGAAEALLFYRRTLQKLLRESSDPRWEVCLALTPCQSDRSFGAIRIVGQGSGDLGARMARLMERFRARPRLIVGSDSPDLTARHIAAAFRALKRCDAVFSPAPDGGFALIGLRALFRRPALFQNVRWSSRHALQDARRSLGRAKITLLQPLADIDSGADYRRWKSAAKLHGA